MKNTPLLFCLLFLFDFFQIQATNSFPPTTKTLSAFVFTKIDADGDGFSLPDDCDDSNPNIFPGAPEICNGLDDNCDGLIDEGNLLAVNFLPVNPGFCPGGSVVLNATTAGAIAYLWSTGATTATITASTTGTYAVVITNSTGCTGEATATVNEFSEPDMTSISVFDNSGILNDDKICTGSEVVIAANVDGSAGTPPFSFKWKYAAPSGASVSFIDVNSSFSNSTWTNTAAAPQTIILRNVMTDANGCKDSVFYDVVANSPLGLTIERDENSGTPDDGGICFGDEITFISHPVGGSGSFTTFAWSGNSQTWSTEDISDAPPYNNINTLYYLSVTDSYGCSVANLSSAKGITEVELTALPNLVCTPGQNHILINTTGGLPTPSGYLGRVNLPPNVLQFFNTPPAVNYPISQSPGTTVNYHIYMKDEKGCPDSLDLDITVPLELTVNAGPDASICNGNSTQLSASPGGGIGPMNFSWSPPAGLNADNIQNPTASPNSTTIYTVVLTDEMGCLASDEIEVSVLPAPEPGITPPNPTLTCSNPTLLLTASPASSYLWSTNETTQSITVSQSGTYSVVITATNGCTGLATKTVSENMNPPGVNITPANPTLTCTNPTVNLLAGGNGIVSFEWSTGSNNSLITVSQSGTYSVTATGSNGCTAVASKAVSANNLPPSASASPATATLTCSNPSATLTASGGASYLWSTGATTTSITVSQSATYTVTATGGNGCTATAQSVISGNVNPPSASVSPATATLTCSNPSATLTASGGVSYLWSTGATTTSITVSQPATYTVTATGENGCTATAQSVVTNSGGGGSGSISPASYTLNCTNTTVELTASGGGTYLWSNGSTWHQITVGVAGNYSCSITNPGGCSVVVTASISASYLTCYYDADSDGYGTSALSQPNCPQWIDPEYWSLTAGDCADGNPSIHPGAPEICDGLDNDCDGQTDETTLNLALSATQISCFGGNSTLTATATGGQPPYQYQFNWAGWQNGNTKTVLAGTHQVLVKDALGCQKLKTIVIAQPPLLFISALNVTPTGNNKFTVVVVASGGTPLFQFRRSKPNGGWTNWQTSNTFLNVPAGTFTFQVKDSKNCTASATTNCAVGGGNGGDRDLVDQFEARRDFDRAHLFWVTESESDDLVYRIERGETAAHFELLFEKTPDGERPGAQLYEGFDEKPLVGDNFYRLLIFGKDGTTRFSEIKKLNFGNLADHLELWPNPTGGQLFFMSHDLPGETATLVISDLLGCEKRRIDFSKMPEKPVEFDLDGLPNGTYFLQFKTDKSPLLTRRFVLIDE